MNSFELNLDEMRKAQRDLEALRHDLVRHLNAAHDLIHSVPRSPAPKPDPVADKMHDVYRGRADSETGVRGLLEDYLEELDDMIALLDATAAAYLAGEHDAVARLREAR